MLFNLSLFNILIGTREMKSEDDVLREKLGSRILLRTTTLQHAGIYIQLGFIFNTLFVFVSKEQEILLSQAIDI